MTKAGRSVSIVRRTRRAWRRLGAVGFVTLVGKNLRLYLSGDAKDHAYVYNAQFDRDFDVDTLGVVEIDEMAVSDEAAIGAARYEPIQPEFFAHLVERLPAIEPSDFTFVDVGSGKGRALILAAVAGFRTVIGVEFDGAGRSINAGESTIIRTTMTDEITHDANCVGVSNLAGG